VETSPAFATEGTITCVDRSAARLTEKNSRRPRTPVRWSFTRISKYDEVEIRIRITKGRRVQLNRGEQKYMERKNKSDWREWWRLIRLLWSLACSWFENYSIICWNVMLCRLLEICRRFRVSCCFHQQDSCYTDDGSSDILWNVGKFPPYHTESYSRTIIFTAADKQPSISHAAFTSQVLIS